LKKNKQQLAQEGSEILQERIKNKTESDERKQTYVKRKKSIVRFTHGFGAVRVAHLFSFVFFNVLCLVSPMLPAFLNFIFYCPFGIPYRLFQNPSKLAI
jgi:hypothetical protein